MSFLGAKMSKKGVERVRNRPEMAGHQMVATIGYPGTMFLLASGLNQSLIPFEIGKNVICWWTNVLKGGGKGSE